MQWIGSSRNGWNRPKRKWSSFSSRYRQIWIQAILRHKMLLVAQSGAFLRIMNQCKTIKTSSDKWSCNNKWTDKQWKSKSKDLMRSDKKGYNSKEYNNMLSSRMSWCTNILALPLKKWCRTTNSLQIGGHLLKTIIIQCNRKVTWFKINSRYLVLKPLRWMADKEIWDRSISNLMKLHWE